MLKILGIKIDNLSYSEALVQAGKMLFSGQPNYIVTPNPEIILAAARGNEELFYILNQAQLSLPDGFGLKIAAALIRQKLTRITGADFSKDLLSLAEEKKIKTLIVNYKDGFSNRDEIAKVLKDKYSNLDFLVLDGDKSGQELDWLKINEYKPVLVFCTFGQIQQEKFIFQATKKIPSLRLGIGVGGTFDFLTKKRKRASKIFRILGLEWFWRLLIQPNRFKRIVINAVFLFSWEIFLWRFIHPFQYRKNVAAFIYRQKDKNDDYEILVLSRHDPKSDNHWQLPQGGTDGATLEKAARKEVAEETGITKLEKTKICKIGYIYNNRYETLAGYKGQKQDLVIFKFLDEDKNIAVNYWEHKAWQWVDAKKLIETLHPYRQEAGKIYLQKFWELVNK
jgi:N-acetylglucosaminyldiphosphoundecaprenol N-acetyl-beta-D-mannosaminyltransferase